jgi:hypothetical protein
VYVLVIQLQELITVILNHDMSFYLESLLKGIRCETREETNAKSRMIKRALHHHRNTQKQARKK